VSIAAKFSLRSLILENWSVLKLKTANSCFIDIANDTKLAADCPFVGIYQLPDIATGARGGAFDPFVIRYYYSATAAFEEMDAEIAFGALTNIFKHGIERREYSRGGIKYLDDFEYVNGTESKAGRQTTGSKLPYKQFTVFAPKTNIL